MASQTECRRDTAVFIIVLLSITGLFYAVVLTGSRRSHWFEYSAVFMWLPALAALITMLVRHRSLRGLGWAPGAIRYHAIAYVAPLASVFFVYGVVWMTGLGQVSLQPLADFGSRFGLSRSPSGLLMSAGLLAAIAPLGIVTALGEEIGWRGFLTPRLVASSGFVRASLVVGLIWAVWHYPGIVVLLPKYRPGLPLWFALICFTAMVVGVSFVHTWLRTESGSVWPSVLFHACGNAFLGAFELMTKDAGAGWTVFITNEYGLGFALLAAAVAVVLVRHRDHTPMPSEIVR